MGKVMDQEQILRLLRQVSAGEVAPQEALLHLKTAPFEDLGYAKPDFHRGLRQGVGEVIYGQNKTPEQIVGILQAMAEKEMKNILVTRISPQTAEVIERAGVSLQYHAAPQLGIAFYDADVPKVGHVVVASGGTSDIPVCEEAAITAEVFGSRVTRLYDVGVAGIHRLLTQQEVLATARAVVAVAGMEGALASVIGGLVSCPVVAVPTSVGYGANFGGVAALLSMLNSCSSGVSVVNIDNGFGAGYIANSINKMEGIE